MHQSKGLIPGDSRAERQVRFLPSHCPITTKNRKGDLLPKLGATEKPIPERFWPKVDKRSPDECWPWTGSRLKGREIGTFWNGDGLSYASRVSYELANGPVPAGLYVLHSCNNPICVNPAHLRAGTQLENMADRKKAGWLLSERG